VRQYYAVRRNGIETVERVCLYIDIVIDFDVDVLMKVCLWAFSVAEINDSNALPFSGTIMVCDGESIIIITIIYLTETIKQNIAHYKIYT